MKEELLDGRARATSARTTTSRRTSRRSYRPWQQRIAFVPDGDLFQGIVAGKASVVTDEIDRFTEKGILLKSGEELEADIIVTATGFNLSVLGDIAFTIDGKPLDFADTVTYRGMMFTGVPNLALGVRLLPRQLDAARRPGRRLRLPAAQPHGGEGREAGHGGAAAARTATCRCCPGSTRRTSIPAT